MTESRSEAWIEEAVEFVQKQLAASADPEKARGMQAYMKTEMPFYGVLKAGRTPIVRHLVKQFKPSTGDEYESLVRTLWAMPHREEKYIALSVARRFKSFIRPDRLPLYHDLIVEGSWWDFVDEVATKLIGQLVLDHPGEVWPVVDGWAGHENMWLRRTAIICQIGAKEETDRRRLFLFSEAMLDEKEFFIRKAIGWALREYAKTDRQAVADFVRRHADEMSGLTYREASKHIRHLVEPT